MTLLTMLIALIVERLAVRGKAWQLVSYLRPYLQASERGLLAEWSVQSYGRVLWWLLPALLVGLVVYLVKFWLFQLVLNTLVLLICMGSWHYRQYYKQYLNALQRDDAQAAFMIMQQMRDDQGAPELTDDQQLIWLNFRYYVAVLCWYALLGAFGAVAYACLRQLAEPVTYQKADGGQLSAAEAEATAGPAYPHQSQWQQFATDLLHLADWLPVRLAGLGMALVGDFSRTSAVLLQYAGDLKTAGAQVLAKLSQAAAVADPQQTPMTQATAAVALAKRNILFFLALVAMLTLSGALG